MVKMGILVIVAFSEDEAGRMGDSSRMVMMINLMVTFPQSREDLR